MEHWHFMIDLEIENLGGTREVFKYNRRSAGK